MNWIVAYDIAEDRRRDQIATLLSHKGWRIQFSVFEVEMSAKEAGDLIGDMTECMDELVDRIHLFSVSRDTDRRVMLGQATLPSEDRFYIV